MQPNQSNPIKNITVRSVKTCQSNRQVLTILDMSKTDFYQQHLDRVSRSFAFCIRELDEPLRSWVGLSYLLCRVLDTIEDTYWGDKAKQIEQLRKFNQYLQHPPSINEFNEWLRHFPEKLQKDEKALLNKSAILFEDLEKQSTPAQNILRRNISIMNGGMEYFISKNDGNSIRLQTLAEVNQYCFFVAGIIGELLTQLILIKTPFAHSPATLMCNAHHFGLFLQKVNLLKDQQSDETEKRYLVPDRNKLLISLLNDSLRAFEYLKSIPVEEKGYRTFCGWSLMLGLASLPWISRAWSEKSSIKIPRVETSRLLEKIKNAISDNQKLSELFSDLYSAIPEHTLAGNQKITSSKAAPAWFQEIYTPGMPVDHMADLGFID